MDDYQTDFIDDNLKRALAGFSITMRAINGWIFDYAIQFHEQHISAPVQHKSC